MGRIGVKLRTSFTDAFLNVGHGIMNELVSMSVWRGSEALRTGNLSYFFTCSEPDMMRACCVTVS